MQAIYIFASLVSFIGVISLWILLKVSQLTFAQKLALLLTTFGIVVPIVIGFIDGMLHG